MRNRPRKPGRPLGRGFDSFTFRQFRAAMVQCCCARVGWALASPRRCKRPASAVVVQFHPYPPAPRRPQRRPQDGYVRGRGLTAESLSATQGVWVRLPPSAPIHAQSRTCDRIPDQAPFGRSSDSAALNAAVRLDRHAAAADFRRQFDGFRRRSDHSPGSARTVSGTIAQLGEPPPCKREMRVRVPLVSTHSRCRTKAALRR